MTNKHLKYYFIFIPVLFLFFPAAYSQIGIVETIYFKSNSYSIDKKYQQKLDSIALRIQSDTFSFLKVFGYADRTGSDHFNDILSEKRANAVYGYLAAKVKIDTTKLYVTWLGASVQDVAYDLHLPSANIQKRCVDIWVSFYKKPTVGKSKER